LNSLTETDFYRYTFDLSNEGIWILDSNLNTVQINQRLIDLLELDKYAYNSTPIQSIIPFDENKHFYFELQKNEDANQLSREYSTEILLNAKKWFQIRIRTVYLHDHTPQKLIFFNDISHLKIEQEQQLDNFRMYFSLFEDSPIPIWEEDFSNLKKEIDKITLQGYTDFKDYFDHFPEEIDRLSKLIIINKINKAVVELNEASSKEHVLTKLKELRSDEFTSYLVYQFNAIARNELSCEFDAQLKTTKGNIRHVLFKWTVVKGFEKNYGKVYLTTTDLTKRIIEENINLAQSNRDKEILLREIHHRVKNNFQIISSLIRLQSEIAQKKSVDEVFQILLNRIYSMATVHELLYRSDRLEAIPLQDYLIHLIKLLIDTLNVSSTIESDIRAENVQIPLEQASPFGLIINEIITNSIKHGFEGRALGSIYLHARKTADNRLFIEIGDNGKGMNTILSTEDTLGLSLVQSLVEQLNGQLTAVSKSNGTHYTLSFPV
jgi:two-component sensor histidine kinase